MKRLALLFLLTSGTAHADECDTRAADAATELGATITPRTASGFVLRNQNTEVIRVACRGGQVFSVSATKLNSDPVQPFIQKVARITGTTLAVDERDAARKMLQCMRLAGDSGRVYKVISKEFALECLVLVDDLTLLIERRS